MATRRRDTRKKRTRGQRGGELGEADFRSIALREGLLPTKVEHDYGIDFLCAVEARPDRAGTSNLVGVLIGAAVRTSDKPRARSKLAASDAGELLAAQFPVCVVLLDLQAKPVAMHFRFVEGEFALKLAEFVDGSADELTLTPAMLLPRADFQRELVKSLQPGHAERLRLLLAERGLVKAIPDSRLEIERDANGDLTIVELRSAVDQFEMGTPEKRRAVYDAIFGAPALLPDRFVELPRKPSMFAALRGLPPRILIAGPMRAHTCVIEVRDGSASASCEFTARVAGEWHGYVHDSGLSIRVSRAIERNGQMVHLTESAIDKNAAIDLGAVPDLWAFLELCSPSARLFVDDDEFPGIDSFGDLLRFGFFARNLRSVYKLKPMPGSWLLGADLKDEHLHSIGCLAATIERKINISAIGALLGPAEKGRDELETRNEIMWTPIVMNVPAGGLVLWLRVEATIFIDDGQYVGFQAERLLDIEIEHRPGAFSKTEWPELVVRTGYPSIAIGAEGLRYGTDDVTSWECSSEVEDPSTQRPRRR